ncbi:MAG TPA: RDD family protein [Thermoplasmata archaeon]
MPSAFGLSGNPALQDHWIRRLFAFLIDAVVVFVIGLFLGIPLSVFGWVWWLPPLFFGIIWFVYSMLLEGFIGGTIGKRLLSIRVVALDGNLSLMHTIARNLSKVYWLVFLADLFIGAATRGDPRQRLFDRFARTTVTRVDQGAYMEEQFRMMQHAPPYPMTPQGTYPQAPPPSAPPPAPQPAGASAGAAAGWPGQAPPQSTWPQHSWDDQGKLVKETKFCAACGGQLVARGDGKLACVRCGATY